MESSFHQLARKSDRIEPESLEILREAAKSLDFDYEPVAVRGWLAGIDHRGSEAPRG